MKSRHLVIVLLILLSLAACGPQSEPASPPAQDAAGATATPPVPATPSPPSDQPFVILERSGGFAGVSETILVNGDGTVVIGRETERVKGGAAAAAELARQLEATGIYDVKPGRYLPGNTCCDRFTYKLTLVKDGQEYHYVTMDGAENVPPELVEAISLVREYAEGATQS